MVEHIGHSLKSNTVYPIEYAHSFIVLILLCCCGYDIILSVLMWYIYPHPSGLLHWNWGKYKITLVPVK